MTKRFLYVSKHSRFSPFSPWFGMVWTSCLAWFELPVYDVYDVFHNILEFTITFVFFRQFLCAILKIKKETVKGLENALSYRDEITNLFVMIIYTTSLILKEDIQGRCLATMPYLPAENVFVNFACGLFSILVLLSNKVSMRGYLRRVGSIKDGNLTVDGTCSFFLVLMLMPLCRLCYAYRTSGNQA